jgi:hypothetical protein
MASDALEFMRQRHGRLAASWQQNEDRGWIEAVSAIQRATVDYCGLGQDVTLTPQAGGKIAFPSVKVWPPGGMVYGSLAQFPQGGDLDWQEHHRRVREWTDRHERFLAWRKAVSKPS